MKLSEYLKEKKLGLSIHISLFILLVVSLVFRNIKPDLYPVSVFLMSLIFIFSQYFDFEYRYFISFALILLVACPFLLIAKYETLAEYFANYVYGFLVIGVVGYFLDNLRVRLKKKGYFKIYRLIFLSFLILVLISPFVIYRNYISKLPDIIKHANYYIKKESVKLNHSLVVENIIITVENPKEDIEISGIVKISGWAIEGNSQDNSGIDRIEIFIDGKPGMGKHLDLGNAEITEEDSPAYELVKRFYSQCYDQEPEDNKVNYWSIKLESGEVSIDDIAKKFILSEEFKNRNLKNEEYVNILYEILLNREPDNIGLMAWLDRLGKGMTRNVVLYEFLRSVEYKGLCRNYYDKISEYVEYMNVGINLPREDIGNSYGEQFKMSGFIFNFDSTEFENGEHTIYVYAYSPYFGWDYVSFDIYIDN
jgi:hypothetical protein